MAIEAGRQITVSLYEQAGGARGILRGHLDRVIQRQVPANLRANARRLIEALVTADKRRALRTIDEISAELAPYGLSEEDVTTLTHTLVDSRLLSVGESESGGLAYELAHDYLLDEIELDPDVQARKTAKELLAKKLPYYLSNGILLNDAELAIIKAQYAWLSLSRDEDRLIQDSRSAINRRRLQLYALACTIVIVIVTALAMIILLQSWSAQELKVANLTSDANALLAQAQLALAQTAQADQGIALAEAEAQRAAAEASRLEALAAQQEAEANLAAAKAAEAREAEARALAEGNLEEADRQRQIAEQQEALANTRRTEAEISRAQAAAQTDIAQQQAKIAQQQADFAATSRAQAVEQANANATAQVNAQSAANAQGTAAANAATSGAAAINQALTATNAQGAAINSQGTAQAQSTAAAQSAAAALAQQYASGAKVALIEGNLIIAYTNAKLAYETILKLGPAAPMPPEVTSAMQAVLQYPAPIMHGSSQTRWVISPDGNYVGTIVPGTSTGCIAKVYETATGLKVGADIPIDQAGLNPSAGVCTSKYTGIIPRNTGHYFYVGDPGKNATYIYQIGGTTTVGYSLKGTAPQIVGVAGNYQLGTVDETWTGSGPFGAYVYPIADTLQAPTPEIDIQASLDASSNPRGIGVTADGGFFAYTSTSGGIKRLILKSFAGPQASIDISSANLAVLMSSDPNADMVLFSYYALNGDNVLAFVNRASLLSPPVILPTNGQLQMEDVQSIKLIDWSGAYSDQVRALIAGTNGNVQDFSLIPSINPAPVPGFIFLQHLGGVTFVEYTTYESVSSDGSGSTWAWGVCSCEIHLTSAALGNTKNMDFANPYLLVSGANQFIVLEAYPGAQLFRETVPAGQPVDYYNMVASVVNSWTQITP